MITEVAIRCANEILKGLPFDDLSEEGQVNTKLDKMHNESLIRIETGYLHQEFPEHPSNVDMLIAANRYFGIRDDPRENLQHRYESLSDKANREASEIKENITTAFSK